MKRVAALTGLLVAIGLGASPANAAYLSRAEAQKALRAEAAKVLGCERRSPSYFHCRVRLELISEEVLTHTETDEGGEVVGFTETVTEKRIPVTTGADVWPQRVKLNEWWFRHPPAGA